MSASKSSLPLPPSMPLAADAPAEGACVKLEFPEAGLAVLVLDPPHRSLAVLDVPLLRDLALRVGELEARRDLRGLVITGRSAREFAAGADLEALEALRTPADVESSVRWVHALFARIAALPLRKIAAVGGAVPGGAYELSLCCDAILATDAPETRIGLPETQLGILPGWGGADRLPRRVGVATALEAILSGKLYPAAQAQKLGLVDRLCARENLRAIGAHLALGRERLPRRSRGWKGWLLDKNPLVGNFLARAAKRAVLAKTHGHYPAPLAVIPVISSAPYTPLSRMAAREAAAVTPLITGSVAKNLIAIFRSSEESKRLARKLSGPPLERAAVIGAGVMGAGIARLLAEKQIRTRLCDLAPEALDRALLEHRDEVKKKLAQRRLSRSEADAAIDALDAVRGTHGLARCQLAIEAVAEKLEVKRKVFQGLAAQMPADALLATNTSSLSVDAIAEGVPHPERVLGLHFFNPVKAMPLVEVVRGSRTSEESALRAAALVVKLGKTPVLVRDVPGFLVNRVLGPYLDEAVRLLELGADVARVDAALVRFGMPMGPYALLDEIGLDIAGHAGDSLALGYGARMATSQALKKLVTPQRLGKKSGFGLYRHERGKKPVPAEDLASLRTSDAAASWSDEQIVDRLILPLVNECWRCLAEQVVASERELDLALIFGTGFAPFRGGPLRYAASVGVELVRKKLEALAGAPDVAARGAGAERFAPTAAPSATR
ncbi:MAG: enoyl-CoA hydratase/isomerase family protein [Planctomycetes bacterium]|nr:enoyl-CoA hydratase/isomerase family protein [Planctomycetota bacterium]